jgi:hypothetical protein
MDDMDEPISPDAADVNGTAAIRTVEGSGSGHHEGATNDTGAADGASLRPTFMNGLAAAMREAAVRERERIASVVSSDAATHIEKVRSRAAIESDELRRLAEEDVERIDHWSTSEIERIKAEAAKKVEERRSSLDEYLKQHDTIIDTEIEGVNGAVREYEATLDRFFAELAEITDPSEIVRRAGQLPTPPDLDEIRASARASAMAQIAESEADAGVATVAQVERTEAVTEAVPEPAEPAPAEVNSPERIEATAATESTESVDDVALPGVMDDGAGSVEPTESSEQAEREVAVAEEGAPREAETGAEVEERPAVPQPVGIMDPDAQRVPSWPAPAPRAEAAPIAPTIDHTSAAVRLLRSVAPWTAPTHAGDRGESDSD